MDCICCRSGPFRPGVRAVGVSRQNGAGRRVSSRFWCVSQRPTDGQGWARRTRGSVTVRAIPSVQCRFWGNRWPLRRHAQLSSSDGSSAVCATANRLLVAVSQSDGEECDPFHWPRLIFHWRVERKDSAAVFDHRAVKRPLVVDSKRVDGALVGCERWRGHLRGVLSLIFSMKWFFKTIVINKSYQADGFLAVDSWLCEMILIAFHLATETVYQTWRRTIRHQEIVSNLPSCHGISVYFVIIIVITSQSRCDHCDVQEKNDNNQNNTLQGRQNGRR